jgi:hypothetical protein
VVTTQLHQLTGLDSVLRAGPMTKERTDMINFLGTILFMTIVVIGWFDSKASLSLFGKYTSFIGTGRPARPRADDPRDGEDQPPKPPASAL